MKNLTKLSAVLTTLALTLGLVACTSPAAPPAASPTSVVPTVAFDAEKSAEIIIVGAGAGGLAAAAEAIENGAKSVIILEKTASTGGSLNFTSGSISGAETIIQELDKIVDTKESFVQDILRNGDNKGDETLIRAFVEEDVAAIQWLWDNGLSDNKFSVDRQTNTMNTFAPEHALYSTKRTVKSTPDDPNAYKSSAHEILDIKVKGLKEVAIDFSTTATQLLQNEKGQVLSVLATTSKGETIKYTAEKGVIMATGGYSGNTKLIAAFTENGGNYLEGGSSSADGYGIYMMQEVGANIDKEVMGYVPTFPMGLDTGEGPGKIAATYTWKAGGICINQEGNRFVDETESKVELRELALEKQTNAIQYDIFTDEIIKDLTANGGSMFWDFFYAPGKVYNNTVVTATSIEELAGKLNVPADQLKKTVDSYNASVESKTTDEFGRKYTDDSLNTYNLAVNKIEGNSYYAVPLKALCVMTLGGVKTNTDAQVLDANGTVIPGLYAAGECVGGIWGRFVSSGTGVMSPIVFGRLAARSALAATPAEGYTIQASQNIISKDLFVKEIVKSEPRFDMTKTLKDGDYEATVDGQEGKMVVKTTVKGGKISAVEVVSNNETLSIAAPAMESIPAEIVAKNSCDVDVISGATLTSDRIMDAVADCLAQASK